jgi:hypothetical protein
MLRYCMITRGFTALCLWLLLCSFAAAETVNVKYRGDVPLDSFTCETTTHSSFVNRVCYDADQAYINILLQSTYYHYCEIDQGTVADLLDAKSMGQYYNAKIRSKGGDGPFDCRTHRVPLY